MMHLQNEDFGDLSRDRNFEPELFQEAHIESGQKLQPRSMKDTAIIYARIIIAIISLFVVLLTSLFTTQSQSPNCGGIDIISPSIMPCIYVPPNLDILVIVCITVVFLNIVFNLFLGWSHKK